MKKIFNLLLILTLAAGCSRYIDSSDVTQELPTQPPIPIGLKLTHLTEGVNLSWQVSDTAVARSFKIYTADSLNGRYVVRDSTQTFSKTITGLSTGRNYYFKVSTVVTGKLEGPLSEAVSTRLGLLSVTINNDDKYTRSQSVTLAFIVPVAATLVQTSEDPNFVDAHWENFSPTLSQNLSNGEGVKHIYARFQFADGSASAGSVSDSIILDTRAFIDSVYFAMPPVPSPGTAIAFYLRAGEIDGSAEVSFPGVTRLILYDDGTNGDLLASDRIYSRRYIIPVNFEVTDGIVTGKFHDAAGNSADDRTASTLLNISLPPQAVKLAVRAQDSSSVLTWTTNADDDFASYQIYRDTIPGITETTGRLLTIINSQSTTTFTDTRPDNRKYYYKIYVCDQRGLTTGSNEVSAP
jgi:hypothetical protein